MKRKYSQAFGKVAKYGGQALGHYLKRRFLGGPSSTKTKSKSGGSSYFLTSQHDARLVYRKRSMPKYKKRRWKKFKKRVRAVGQHLLPRQTVVHTDLVKPTCAVNEQAVVTLSLYPGFSAIDNSLADIQKCMSVAVQSATEANQTVTNYTFRAGLLEAAITNKSTKTIYLDCYWAYCKKDSTNDPQTLFGYGLRDTTTARAENAVSAIGTTISENTLGATPFQSTQLCRYYTITKKTRYLLGAGNTVQLEWRDPKNHYLKADGEELGLDYIIKKGWTKTWFMVFYAVPDATNKSQAIDSGDVCITRYVNYIFNPVDASSKRYAVTV